MLPSDRDFDNQGPAVDGDIPFQEPAVGFLVEAKRLLDASLAKVPGEHHAAMLANVRLNREIAAAAREAGL